MSNLCLSVSASGADNFTYNGVPMSWVLFDENGNAVASSSGSRVSYGSVDIPNGYTMFFHNEEGEDFRLYKGDTVDVSIRFTTAVKCLIGHTQQGESAVNDYDNTSGSPTQNPSVSIDIPATGYYHFWVTNMTTDTVTMSSATVTNT